MRGENKGGKEKRLQKEKEEKQVGPQHKQKQEE